jgi:23S rRNA (uridine2552-2'-O)-methyltransferase
MDGYRSRAAYKLTEIHQKFGILKDNAVIVDLGAAPGSWSQATAKLTKYTRIISIDILEMQPIPEVEFICGDFLDSDTQKLVIDKLAGNKADIVLSDMAANTTGHKATDHIRTIMLCDISLEFALNHLKIGGNFVSKVFGGGTEKDLLNKIKRNFSTVRHFKPAASRKESKEYYLIAMGYRGPPNYDSSKNTSVGSIR